MKKRFSKTQSPPLWNLIAPFLQIAAAMLPVSVVLLASTSNASQATVIKVKGRQAIVQFPADYVPAAGDKVEVAPAEGMNTPIDPSSGSRAHTIGVSANISLISNSSSGNSGSSSSSTNINVTGLYGWNFEIIEVGPTLGLSYKSSNGASATSFQGGGFIDYNLLPNKAGVKFVAGVGAQAYVGSSSPSSGSSTSLLGIAGGGQFKWFCFGHQTALRGDLLADYERQGSTITTTQTGVVMKLGIQTYF